MSICTIRGAITIEENTQLNILDNTKEILKEIIKQNDLSINDIISIIFTATKDIDAVYPAVAARELGITQASLVCSQEMYVKDSLNLCIRVLFMIESDKKQSDMKHIYLKEARKLRQDLCNRFFSIAIDGPAGSGKSTVAKLIAKELNYIYVDTGAMYRTVALYCIQNNIECYNEKKISKVISDINITFEHKDNEQKIYLNNKDVTELIRSQKVSEGSSQVARMASVRTKLVDIQRKISENQNIVMDGRDIGTNVLPNADVKIYMDADVSERAKRRCNELKEKNIEYDYYEIKNEIIKRDENDMNRKISPLKKADDAIVLNTTNLNAEQVKEKIMEIVNKRINNS